MNIHFSRRDGGDMPFPNIKLYHDDGKPNDNLVACFAAISGESINIADVYQEKRFDFSGTKAFDKKSGYRCQSLLAIPMTNHEDKVVGVLQLINAKDVEKNCLKPFLNHEEHLVKSLASQAAVMLTQLELIQNLKDTFTGFVKAMAEALDKKVNTLVTIVKEFL